MPGRRLWIGARNERRRLRRIVIEPERVEIRQQRDAQHERVAALDPAPSLEEGIGIVNDAEIDRRRCLEAVAERFVPVVVRVELELSRKPSIGVRYSTPPNSPILGAVEIVEGEPARGRGHGPLFPRIRQSADRIGDRHAARHPAPAEAEGEIEIVIAPAGDEIFAREQAGPRDVAEPDRELGKIGAFPHQAQLQVERAVLVGLSAAEGRRTIGSVGDIGIAESRIEPGQRRQEDIVSVIGMDMREGEAEIAVGAGARGRNLHQPMLAPIVDRGRVGRRRTDIPGLGADGRREGANGHGGERETGAGGAPAPRHDRWRGAKTGLLRRVTVDHRDAKRPKSRAG